MRLAFPILFASCLVAVSAPAPIQHNPWTTTTNDPSVTLQAQQPVSITTTSNISLFAPSLIATTNLVNGMINVKSPPFNAKGDGIADDTAAIQAAINLTANGGTLVFPQGIYSISAMLTMTTNGVGKSAVSHFRMLGLGSMKYTPGMDGFGFDDGSVIVYNGPTDTNTAVFGFASSDPMTLNYSTFENLVFLANNKAGYCVKIEPSRTDLGAPRREDENLHFRGCWFIGALKQGLLAGPMNITTKAEWDSRSPADDLNVDLLEVANCFFSSCGEASIRLVGNNVLNATIRDTLFDSKFFGGGNTNQANYIHTVNSYPNSVVRNAFLPLKTDGTNTPNLATCVSAIKVNFGTIRAVHNYSEDVRFYNNQEGFSPFVSYLAGNWVNESRVSVKTWQANHVAGTPTETNAVYLPGKYTIIPTVPNGFHYVCSTSGTNGPAEPTWPTTPGNLVTNGTSVFRCESGGYLLEPYSLSDSLSSTVVIGNSFATAATEDVWSNAYLNQSYIEHTIFAPAFHSYAGVSTLSFPNCTVLDINGVFTPQFLRIGSGLPNLYPLEVAGSILAMYPGGFLSLNPTNGNVWISGANTAGGYSIQENAGPGASLTIDATNGLVHLPFGLDTTNTISGAVSVDSKLFTAYHNVAWPFRGQTVGNIWLSGPDAGGAYEVRENSGPGAAITVNQTSGMVQIPFGLDAVNAGYVNSTNAFRANGVAGVASVIWTNVISGVVTQQFIATGGIITSVTTLP